MAIALGADILGNPRKIGDLVPAPLFREAVPSPHPTHGLTVSVPNPQVSELPAADADQRWIGEVARANLAPWLPQNSR